MIFMSVQADVFVPDTLPSSFVLLELRISTGAPAASPLALLEFRSATLSEAFNPTRPFTKARKGRYVSELGCIEKFTKSDDAFKGHLQYALSGRHRPAPVLLNQLRPKRKPLSLSGETHCRPDAFQIVAGHTVATAAWCLISLISLVLNALSQLEQLARSDVGPADSCTLSPSAERKPAARSNARKGTQILYFVLGGSFVF